MPEPGSHKFDVARTRLRNEFENDVTPNVPDGLADDAARELLEQDNPPRKLDDPRAEGPLGSNENRDNTAVDDAREPGGNAIALRSQAFSDNSFIPARMTKAGGNETPTLEWSTPPEGSAELVLECIDRDAPTGPFTHWLVTGIPAEADGIGSELPPGAVAHRNGFGDTGWGGPQPPVGDDPHRYFFRLYAVDKSFDFAEDASAEDVHKQIADHTVASGTLIGLFGR